MKILEVKAALFPEVKVIRYARFPDSRGFFTESFRKSDLVTSLNLGEDFQVLQVNTSFSKPGTIRGLHFQWKPDMGKLIRVINGTMIDLFLDIRKNSPTFGKIGSHKLFLHTDQAEEEMIWIPPGFAHGGIFPEETYIEYFCNAQYSPTTEAGIYPLSPDIDWSLCDPQLKKEFDELAKNPLISEKDKAGLSVTVWKNDPRSENFTY